MFNKPSKLVSKQIELKPSGPYTEESEYLSEESGYELSSVSDSEIPGQIVELGVPVAKMKKTPRIAYPLPDLNQYIYTTKVCKVCSGFPRVLLIEEDQER